MNNENIFLPRLSLIDNDNLRELNINNRFEFVERTSVVGYSALLTSSFLDVTNNATSIIPYPAAADNLTIVSTSANDSFPSGTGVRLFRITGLDNNYKEITENIFMNGTTPVITTNKFLRINDTLMLLAGSATNGNAQSQGTITVKIGTTSWLRCLSTEKFGFFQGCYTVPAGKSFILKKIGIITSSSKEITFNLMIRSNVLPPQTKLILINAGGNNNDTSSSLIPEKTTLCFAGKVSSGNGATGQVSFSGLTFDNSKIQSFINEI